MFTAVPPRYDLVNRLITWGMDKKWRRQAVLECLAGKPNRMLDLGCGTGDLAINVAKIAGDVEVTGLDYSEPMLEIARKKSETLTNKPEFVQGDASKMPFSDGSFDCVGISFAFRNLTYKNPLAQFHIAEVLRVLGPGGRFIIVESSQPKSKFIRTLYHAYLRGYVSHIGWRVSGNKGAYHYLSESAARYYSPGDLEELLLKAGFSKVTYRPLFFGAAGITVAIK